MKLEQSFKVAGTDRAVWEALIDVERVAPCLPGAEITEADDDGTYRGTFTVKLGPTTAAYRGKLKMEDVDEAAHTRDDERAAARTSAARAAPRRRSSRC